MKISISKTLKTVILVEFLLPLVLLILGIYHGLMQVIFRAGMIKSSSALHLNYYQGLTLHGVINAVVLTTFFGVAFGHICMSFFLKREPGKKAALLSLTFMVVGTLMAAFPMLKGTASVLYTFYPPLKGDSLFYMGATLLVVGSWIAFFDWVILYLRWRKDHPKEAIPLAVLGTLVNFLIWFVCTLSVAYEILVLILPWTMGFVDTINVPLSRTLFWFFGHALVYFWLMPSYIAFYVILPKISGGKLYSENAAKLAFFLFLIFSIPVGTHHQFSEPTISPTTKFLQTILTFGVAIPSFMTAFTVAASLEYGAWKRGARGLFSWMLRLPYFDRNHFLFGYFICGLILFFVGGITGLINASYSLNALVHNTAWIPGHFHTTVAGPVFLAILGLSMFFIPQLMGKEIKYKNLLTMVPYVWVVGVCIFSTGLMIGGLRGEPRRTNLGISYLNPNSDMFRPEWISTTQLAFFGGVIMTISFVLFLISFLSTICSAKKSEAYLDVPTYEVLHVEKPIALLNSFKPWIILMFILILFAYIPALIDIFKYYGGGAPAYLPESPIPVAKP